MTTQTAVFSGLPTGLTLTKKVFTVADPDTEVTGITGAVTERTNAKGQYVIAVTKAAVITGDHTIILFVGSSPIAIGKRTFVGTDGETATITPEAAVLNTEYLFDDGFGRKAVNANVTHYQGTLQGNGDLPAKLDAIKDVTNKIDTGLVLDGVVWQFTVNMLEAAIAEVPKYGDIQRHAQEDYDVTSKTVDVTVTKVT